MYLVKYKVEGFPGEHTAGPYPEVEAQFHRDDIAGFEGVRYAIIVSMEEHLKAKIAEVCR
jgi:hypothetical protein